MSTGLNWIIFWWLLVYIALPPSTDQSKSESVEMSPEDYRKLVAYYKDRFGEKTWIQKANKHLKSISTFSSKLQTYTDLIVDPLIAELTQHKLGKNAPETDLSFIKAMLPTSHNVEDNVEDNGNYRQSSAASGQRRSPASPSFFKSNPILVLLFPLTCSFLVIVLATRWQARMSSPSPLYRYHQSMSSKPNRTRNRH